MLNISLTSIKKISEELTGQISEYEEDLLSTCQEVFNTQPNWHDQNSNKFFDNISTQKIDIQKFILNLKLIDDSYKKIIEEITKINVDEPINVLFVNQNKKIIIMDLYNTLINSLRSTNQKLSSLNISFCKSNEKSLIKIEIQRLNKIIMELTDSKNKVEKLFDELKIAEQNIIKLLTGIEISSRVKEIDYSEFLIKGEE